MKKVCCPNGHYYDADKFRDCPICQPSSSKTEMPVQELSPADSPSTTANSPIDFTPQETTAETPAATGPVVMCTNGHVFNPALSIRCPICGFPAENSMDPPQERKKTICPNGHVYDGNRFSSCPICEQTAVDQPAPNVASSPMEYNNALVQPEVKLETSDNSLPQEEIPTAPDTDEHNSCVEVPAAPTRSAGRDAGTDESSSAQQEVPTGSKEESETQSFADPAGPLTDTPSPSTKPLPLKTKELPVGWVIGFQGVYRGTLFCCYPGRNSLGRSYAADIDLSLDPSIEDEIQAFVIYDPRQRQFFLQAGTGKGLVYRNDGLVFSHDPLEAYDHIQIGNSDFVFVPLCGPHFSWEEE